MNIYLVIFLTLIAALFTSYSQLLFKRGLKKRLDTVTQIIGTLRNRYIFIGLCGYVVSFTLYLIALAAFPIVSGIPDIRQLLHIRYIDISGKAEGEGKPDKGCGHTAHIPRDSGGGPHGLVIQ